ncbi:Hypothetical predicted protein [Paramuricea clavata]|uniref:Uncharacterized protein n=1 Tax=Paramuricea clavata TaxID=317549 RepID=A0A6S7J131_PARCT|nr:Hypothetical predicted protein [Paramuricea clavata]
MIPRVNLQIDNVDGSNQNNVIGTSRKLRCEIRNDNSDNDTEENIPEYRLISLAAYPIMLSQIFNTCVRKKMKVDVLVISPSQTELLQRCVLGTTENQNGSLNALAWTRYPKHKQHGHKAVQCPVAAAIPPLPYWSKESTWCYETAVHSHWG